MISRKLSKDDYVVVPLGKVLCDDFISLVDSSKSEYIENNSK